MTLLKNAKSFQSATDTSLMALHYLRNLQPEMVRRSCRSETLKGSRRLPNHRSQNQDKSCIEDQHYRTRSLDKSVAGVELRDLKNEPAIF